MRLSRRCRTCIRLMSAAFLCTSIVIWFYGINSELPLGRTRLVPWPVPLEHQQDVPLAGGGASRFEDRWDKYSLNASVRLAVRERLSALQSVSRDEISRKHAMFVESLAKREQLMLPHEDIADPNVMDDRLMSANLSGALNEQLRREYWRVSNETIPTDARRIWWQSSAKNSNSDRILAQMSHVPRNYRRLKRLNESPVIKSIYVDGGFDDVPMGREKFVLEECPVDACRLTSSPTEIDTADMRLFQANAMFQNSRKPPGQIWAMFLLESPANTVPYENTENLINWTATYRWDSTIVTPYAKFVPFHNLSSKAAKSKKAARSPRQTTIGMSSEVALSAKRNYAEGKTRKVAWFVSNCNAKNNRLEYVKELSKYIAVDVYGLCGPLVCIRSDEACAKMLNDQYKFYLSFENSNCDYYMTEKFFETALLMNIVPIVMGGRKADYVLAAPRHSFIHVDQFPLASDLAKYLHRLDQNDDLYNQYFDWKGTGEFINTKFWCRLCALLHDDSKPHMWYTDFNKWWMHDGACRLDQWN